MTRLKRNLLVESVLVLLVAVAVSGVFISATPADFHCDEAHKISEAYYYHLFFVQRQWDHPDWNEDFFARVNPPAGKYIMGAWLSWHGTPVRDRSLQERFVRMWNNTAALSKEIPPEVLKTARNLSGIFGMLTLVVVYLIGRLSGNLLAGALGATLLFCHPSFQYHSVVALTDIILLCFMSGVVLLTIVVLRQFHGLRNTRFWSRCGFITTATMAGAGLIALAAGTKLNGGLAGIFFVSALGLAALVNRFVAGGAAPKAASRDLVWIAGGATLGAVLLFVAFNPYFYESPISRIAAILKTNHDWMVAQQIHPGEPIWHANQKLSAISVLNFTWPQVHLGLSSAPFLYVAFVLGTLVLARRVITEIRAGQFPAWEICILLWVTIYGIGIGWWIPLLWDRYFLPLAPLIAVVAGYGLVFLAQLGSDLHQQGLRKAGWWRPLLWPAATALISLGLWSIVVDYTLLSPEAWRRIRGNCSPDYVPQLYNRAQQTHSTDPVRSLHAADVNQFRNPTQAHALFRAGVDLAEHDSDQARSRVLLAASQHRFAQLCVRLSRYSEARELLQANIELLRRMKAEAGCGDPTVLDLYDQYIDSRAALLKKIAVRGPTEQKE